MIDLLKNWPAGERVPATSLRQPWPTAILRFHRIYAHPEHGPDGLARAAVGGEKEDLPFPRGQGAERLGAGHDLFAALGDTAGSERVMLPQGDQGGKQLLHRFVLEQRATRATNPPPACQNLRLQHGQEPGEVLGKCNSLGDNIRTYEGQWTLDPNAGPWSDPVTFPNSRSFKFTGLTRGKDVWVRVRARNTIGAGPWSDPATIMVT